MIVADGYTLRRLAERRSLEFLPPELRTEDALAQWDTIKPQPQPLPRDTAPATRTAFTHFQHEVLAEVIAEIRAEVRRDIERATQR